MLPLPLQPQPMTLLWIRYYSTYDPAGRSGYSTVAGCTVPLTTLVAFAVRLTYVVPSADTLCNGWRSDTAACRSLHAACAPRIRFCGHRGNDHHGPTGTTAVSCNLATCPLPLRCRRTPQQRTANTPAADGYTNTRIRPRLPQRTIFTWRTLIGWFCVHYYKRVPTSLPRGSGF